MLPFGDGRSGDWGLVISLFSILSLSILVSADDVFADKAKGRGVGKKRQAVTTATPSVSPGEESLTNIPLPIGHEAKGLVLTDFDHEGHLRGRFEATITRRLDE